jgi:uncharacterized protein (TIGR01777 family)
MKILITGGTGFVGSHLAPRLVEEGHEVGILTRRSVPRKESPKKMRFIVGDPTQKGPWQDAVADHDAFINLAGASIFRRWTPDYKKRISDSRILTTRHLVEAIPSGSKKILCSTSAVGYYGFHGDEILGESDPAGDDFLAQLAQDWETEALAAQKKGARVIITRFGIVMGKDGGAPELMALPFKWFVGGPLGSGNQWFSWIHAHDLVEGFLFLLTRPELSGPFNFTAPNPIQNRDMARILGKVIGRPSWIPAPGFMIKLLLGEFGSVILKGQRVMPKRLLDAGFSFQYPEMEGTLRTLLT